VCAAVAFGPNPFPGEEEDIVVFPAGAFLSAGTFIGTATTGEAAFVTITDLGVTVTPEPSSLMLLGCGALGLLGVMRRNL